MWVRVPNLPVEHKWYLKASGIVLGTKFSDKMAKPRGEKHTIFHNTTIIRKRKSNISRLKIDETTWSEEPEILTKLARD